MTVKSDIHARLRQTTSSAHERLHHHDGFAAAAAGTISRQDYQLLLERLWGFHHVFEGMLRDMNANERSSDVNLDKRARAPLLESDLTTLGMEQDSIQKLPKCRGLTKPKNEAEFMGSLYVVEGSTLGGVHIARALKPLFNTESVEGRRFFFGYGEEHGTMWRNFLNQLEESARTDLDEANIIRGADQTFTDFEKWMSEWKHP